MKFPEWVTRSPKGKRLSDEEVASNRLRYLILSAAIKKGGDASVSGFAKHSNEERARIYRYITRGTFPQKMAERIENTMGRDVIRKEHLVFPLEIEATE